MKMQARSIVAAIVTIAAAMSGCRSSDTVVVGAKNFTEQRVLGEIVAQSIEAAGLRTVRRFDLGGSFVCDAALRSGDIDVYVEYTGTALGAILKQPPSGTAADVLQRLREAYGRDGLVWLDPLGFDNAFALVVRDDVEARSISSAVDDAKHWQAAFGYEFEQRADGLPALERVYGLRFARSSTMDLGLLYRALLDRQADVVVGSATDAALARFPLHVLADDRRAFPPYEAVPVLRGDALARHPGLETALRGLAGSIDVAAMRRLNGEVEEDGRTPREVAAKFLRSRG